MTSADDSGVITVRGHGSFDHVLRRTVSSIEARGLEIHSVIDHSGDAAEDGLSMPETKLILIESPQELTRLMVAHPSLAIELPLRLLISERDNGHVVISYHSPDHLAHGYQLTAYEAVVLRLVDSLARRV